MLCDHSVVGTYGETGSYGVEGLISIICALQEVSNLAKLDTMANPLGN